MTQLNQHRLYDQSTGELLSQSTRLPNYSVVVQHYSNPRNRTHIIEHWRKSSIVGFYEYNYINNEITYTKETTTKTKR